MMGTELDNQVEFKLPDVADFYFKITDYCITAGQPWSGIDCVWKDGEYWKMNIRAGREADKKVAAWFAHKVHGGVTIGCGTSHPAPDTLNFAFEGNLMFTYQGKFYEFRRIVLGQEAYPHSQNNWWIGAADAVWCSEPGLLRIETEDVSFPVNLMHTLIFTPGDKENRLNVSNQQAVRGSWMANIEDNTKVEDISIPGTHDSGTEKADLTGVAHCQNFSIAQQLEDGIRFLDIRLNQSFQIYHGWVSCRIDFGQVVSWCKDFLERNAGDTIFISIKAECTQWSNKMNNQLKKYIDSYPELFYTLPVLPDRLGAVRGKIVLLKRDAPCDYGIPFYVKDNTSAATDDETFYVEDCYKSHDTNLKSSQVKEALDKSAFKTADDKYCYITFTSIAFGIGHHTPYQYAWGAHGIDPAMNPWLGSYLCKHSGRYTFGIILMDYYNNHGEEPQLATNIILSNFNVEDWV